MTSLGSRSFTAYLSNPPKGSIPLNGKKLTFKPILQGGSYRGVSGTVHWPKQLQITNHGWQTFISVFESHIQLVKGRFLSCSFAKKKLLKECLILKTLKVAKRKSQTVQKSTYKNSSFSFDAFIFFIYLPEVLKLKIIREKYEIISRISIINSSFLGHGQPVGHGTQRIIYLNSGFMKNKNR